MSKPIEFVRRAVHLGLRSTCEKAVCLFARKLNQAHAKLQDRVRSSYLVPSEASAPLVRYLRETPLVAFNVWPRLRALAELYLDHRFDLLGSGWCQVKHGMRCQGVEGHRYESGSPVVADRNGVWLQGRINASNLLASQSIWRLVDDGYQPIDWHLDYKSGYRWSEMTWHSTTPFGHLPGVDIKVPWELSRMQHLPQLALACKAARNFDGDECLKVRLEREFRNQVLDFIATNPPRFGVNWRCAMDVGIRVANWLMAYDLFCAAGMQPDPKFDAVFRQSIAAHGQHIIDNLEWQRLHRGNHYLADITGLLFVAAYLPCSPKIDAWLAFAARQLSSELLHQFNGDGSNFEASTSYHRLSAEMAVYGVALTLALGPDKQAALANYDHQWIRRQPGLERSPLPLYSLPSDRGESPYASDIFVRLERAAEFSRDITKPDDAVHQIGDNDSGRFFRLQGVYRHLTVREAKANYLNLRHFDELDDNAQYWDEDQLDHRPLVAAIASLTGRDDLMEFAGSDWPESGIIGQLTDDLGRRSNNTLGRNNAANVRIGSQCWDDELAKLASQSNFARQAQVIKLPNGVTNKLVALAYPDFGLFIWRSPRLYLAVRCGPVGQDGNGGHAHNDQLSIELHIDGQDWIADAGTYLYTAAPVARNRYRSVRAHWAPQVDPPREPARLDVSLFQLPDTAKAQCLHFSDRGFIGVHFGFGTPVTRVVELSSSTIQVIDLAAKTLSLKPIPPAGPSKGSNAACLSSQGYGVLRAA